MEGKLRRYRNAFSIAAPAIFNTTSMTGTVLTSNAERASHLMSWAISPEGEHCDGPLWAKIDHALQNSATVSKMGSISSQRDHSVPMSLHSTLT